MRILVLADIHANWTALSAIRETYDACLVLGDLVEYGVQPIECIEWVRDHATAVIRGNHDHSVAQRVPPPTGSGLRGLSGATRQHHWNILTPSHLKFLSRLPVSQTLELDGLRFHLVHATPRDPMDEYLATDAESWKVRLAGIDADFVLVGHTHLQFHLDLGRLQLVNPGSVGQPRDGNPLAAYAIIENGKVELKRVEYDIDAAVRALREVNLPADILDLAESILRTGGRP
ncbi:MAG: YfcE family phosphodiesterase [Planctomycetes bacterium]|nr:YfcE family phosphodiesterase [Planctomycetota bacterium]